MWGWPTLTTQYSAMSSEYIANDQVIGAFRVTLSRNTRGKTNTLNSFDSLPHSLHTTPLLLRVHHHTLTLGSDTLFLCCIGAESGPHILSLEEGCSCEGQIWEGLIYKTDEEEEEGDTEEGCRLAVACRLALRNELRALNPRPRAGHWCKCWQPTISPW